MNNLKVRTMVGAQQAYACIEAPGIAMDVALTPGKSASKSLKESAAEMIEKAKRLQRNANLMIEAALKLEEDKVTVGMPSASIGDEMNEWLPGASMAEIGSVCMTDVDNTYDVPENLPEWAWVEKKASFSHVHNGEDGIWEFVLNLSMDLGEIPPLLQPVFAEARRKNLAYLIFHQGT